MKIGIIGTGAIGGTIARKLAEAGHEIKVASAETLDKTQAFAEGIGATAVETAEVAKNVDVVIISVPTPAIQSLPETLFNNVSDTVIVVDTGNYYPGLRDAAISEIDSGTVESQWVSQQIGRPVVKAFNSLLAHSLAEKGSADGSPDRIAMAVAGDDATAKKVVMQLVNDAGFDPVDAGSLIDSWRFQPGTPAYCTEYKADDLRTALSAAVRDGSPQRRDRVLEILGERGWNVSHDEMIALNRSVNPVG